MAVAPGAADNAPVAGGMVVAANQTVELFDEESGRRAGVATQLVSLPASALQAS